MAHNSKYKTYTLRVFFSNFDNRPIGNQNFDFFYAPVQWQKATFKVENSLPLNLLWFWSLHRFIEEEANMMKRLLSRTSFDAESEEARLEKQPKHRQLLLAYPGNLRTLP